MSDRDTFEFGLSAFIPFRDVDACKRVRAIRRSEITKHANPVFHIRVIETSDEFYKAFATDLVDRIRAARDSGRQFVAILPAGPMAQYPIAADLINTERLALHHVHTFNMDEWANDEGVTPPLDWPRSLALRMWNRFFNLIDEDLRPAASHIHFPSSENIGVYSSMLDELGGADVVYGGVGWSGHVGFWEPQLGREFAGDMKAFRAAGSRVVDLNPITIMQCALPYGGDWSYIPPRAVTIGPKDILGAGVRSFWLDGTIGGDVSWQRFIARLAAHGPVNEFVPGSLLQEAPGDYTMLGAVAADIVL